MEEKRRARVSQFGKKKRKLTKNQILSTATAGCLALCCFIGCETAQDLEPSDLGAAEPDSPDVQKGDVVATENALVTNGLTGNYFNNADFTSKVLTRVDPTLSFDWGTGSPSSAMGSDTFSVQWSGFVRANYSQTYTFYVTSDDGARLLVNGRTLVNNWTNHSPTENSGTIALQAGKTYTIALDYYENTGSATVQLRWSSPSQAKQIIPQAQLFVSDPNDLCPSDPNKTAPGICGCGVADADGDKDGTADCKDGCKTDPTKILPGICGCGVPEGSCSTTVGCVAAAEGGGVMLSCPVGQTINAIKFASYGTPTGACPSGFATGTCHAATSLDTVKALCLNKQSCSVAASNGIFGDPCTGVAKKLAIIHACSSASVDNCPDDPNKTAPGICGCGVADVDSDKDGTADCKDSCKTDPTKILPGICGCGVADVDSDKDGTADCKDSCKTNPTKILPGICGCGVADVDSDKDGTADCKDGCKTDPTKTAPGRCGCGVPEGSCGSCAEAAENQTVTLSCPAGQTIVSVNFASYGLPTGSCAAGFATSSTCHLPSSLATVKALCLDKQSCSVAANNGVFGTACNGVVKKLAVVYTCGVPCAEVSEGSSMTLTCPSGQLIASIDFASYGSPTGSCWTGFATSTCHATTSKSKVQSSCLNEQSCTVEANNVVFGEPCPGTPKKLAVVYSCNGQGLEYYGTNVPSYFTPTPDYNLFDTNILFQGGLDGISHAGTATQGAGKFVFNRIYRATKHGLGSGEQFGIFHWWLHSYGRNSIEGGIWDNPQVAGPHYYPTLHIAGVGDTYHGCSDVQFGNGMGLSIGDKWLAMIQISNRVLTVPGVNIAFDKNQPPYEADNGIWIGWGWTDLNLDHPRGYKYWMSFIESYDYQGPVNGYMPEYWNWVDPKKIADGSYAASRASSNPFGTFATLGSSPDGGIANEQYTKGLHVKDDLYYVPVSRVPSYKAREYVIADIQSIEQQDMEEYSSALRASAISDSLIPTQFIPFNGVHSSTHSQLKIVETINGQEHLTVVRPPYTIGYDTYNGYVEWPMSSPVAQAARSDQNGYLYYQKSSAHWPVEAGASDYLRNHPNLYKSELVYPPDDVRRVPRLDSKYLSFKERDTRNPEFANWDITGKKRYTVRLQNGSTATYVWFKFIEQPAVKTAKQNWPSIYTDAYLARLQTYIENLHRTIAQRSKVNPSNPVFINYRNADDRQHFDPHLVKIDPQQLVVPPAGFEVGYVPVIISVYHPEAYSTNGTGLVEAPDAQCLNSQWSRTYFPDI